MTVIVTVTSWTNHACVPTTSKAMASIATTIYTTDCPLSTEIGDWAAHVTSGAFNSSNFGSNRDYSSGSGLNSCSGSSSGPNAGSKPNTDSESILDLGFMLLKHQGLSLFTLIPLTNEAPIVSFNDDHPLGSLNARYLVYYFWWIISLVLPII